MQIARDLIYLQTLELPSRLNELEFSEQRSRMSLNFFKHGNVVGANNRAQVCQISDKMTTDCLIICVRLIQWPSCF